MKIAFIGNMNNNNFSMLRYFRDLGLDAELLLYLNDGKGALEHFKPENDTWEYEKWKPYIHQTTIPNAPIAAFNAPFSFIFKLKKLLSITPKSKNVCVNIVSRKKIIKEYAKYQILIGSGLSPAILLRIGRKLNIFYPYSTQIEFLYTGEFVNRIKGSGFIVSRILKQVQLLQKRGIKDSLVCITPDSGITKSAFNRINVKSKVMSIPMVYSREVLPVAPPNSKLKRLCDYISSSTISCLHHARLMWKNSRNYTKEEWRKENKNNHWLIHSLAALTKIRPKTNPKLLIVEYGPDVDSTKKLIEQLGITDKIIWLQQMSRKELMWLMAKVTVTVGEFYEEEESIWGGTGWEALASGKPLLQGFKFAPGRFEDSFGYPAPPLLAVTKQEDILQHLIELIDFPDKEKEIGRQAKQWFEQYNGIGLAKKWANIIDQTINL